VGADADADVGADADADVGADADADVEDSVDAEADSTEPDPWAHCPSASEFVGDPGWTLELRVTDGAVYCGRFNESRTLLEEYESKAMLRVVPGSYRLPTTAGEAPFFLPLCLDFGDGSPPTTTGTGTVTHSTSSYGGSNYDRNNIVVALTDGRVEGSLNPVYAGTPPPMVLDGTANEPFGDASSFQFNYCPGGGECWGDGSRSFDSCTFEGTPAQLHHLVLEAGAEVHFELRIGMSPASTEPGAFVRAWGRLGGVDFDQRDYWRLVYNPAHHHFERDFAVFFDSPIGDACGLEVIGLEPWDDYARDQAFVIDCALARVRELTVVSHTLERP
ncbi:MAG: hypothetical protein JXB32_12780, partial [Deltaproteobacteria bacterium]|nr:hypothetical protein [Deltaproteobacteria bacterium]